MQNPSLTFIVKTSFDCNLGCAYCSEGRRRIYLPMGIDSVTAMLRNIGEYARETSTHITFDWHGGEPLLRGLDYYKKIVQAQKKLGIHSICSNEVQTNGLLLDKAFASFFTDNNFGIGVSLDGPQVIHDATRPKKNGKSSFDAVCAGIRNVISCGRDVGIISVITRKTLDHIDEYYDFFRRNELSVRMNPLLQVGKADQKTSLQLTPQEYGEALCYVYDKWINEPKLTSPIEPFYGIIRSIYTDQFNCCFLAGKCQNFFKVFPNGDLYLCGRQYSQKGLIGNVVRDNFGSLMTSPQRKAHALEKRYVREVCGDCRHFDICHGGCTTSALSLQPNGRIGKDYFCDSYRMLFDRIKETMAKALPPTSRGLIPHHNASVR